MSIFKDRQDANIASITTTIVSRMSSVPRGAVLYKQLSRYLEFPGQALGLIDTYPPAPVQSAGNR